jgi:uncharacterized membrane-anchored protein
LVPLALVFSVILVAEHRLRTATETYYWLAIVTLRTAATNLGDLLTHDFQIPYPWAMAGLAAALGAVQFAERAWAPRHPNEIVTGIPNTNLFYWTTMLIAGTLGTAAGDYVADVLGLGVGPGSVVLCALLAVALSARGLLGLIGRPYYWGTVVVVRSAGTTVGDWFAGRHGLALGLPISTAAWAVALFALLLLNGSCGIETRPFRIFEDITLDACVRPTH